jgi:hypothetical protein
MLNGKYALVIPGTYDYYYAWDFSMLATFDGKGGFSGSSLNSVYFDALESGSPETFTGGTYTVNPDCTFTLTTPTLTVLGDAIYANGIVIGTGGDEVVGTVYSPQYLVGTFDAKRVKADRGCSNATLKGRYALVIPGITYYYYYAWDFSMLATFDGKGGFSGSSLNSVYYDALYYSPETFTGGTYTVNRDCTCTLTTPTLTMVGNPVYFNGIIIGPDGDEVVGTLYSASDLAATFDAKRVAEAEWDLE